MPNFRTIGQTIVGEKLPMEIEQEVENTNNSGHSVLIGPKFDVKRGILRIKDPIIGRFPFNRLILRNVSTIQLR
jgi:hypothetical protein